MTTADVTLSLPADVYEQLQSLAEDEGTGPVEVIGRLVAQASRNRPTAPKEDPIFCKGQQHVAHNWRRHLRVDALRDSGIRVGSSWVICVGLVRYLCNMSLPNTVFATYNRHGSLSTCLSAQPVHLFT